VWPLLVENIGSTCEPEALPGWLAETTHRECLRSLWQRNDTTVLVCPPKDQPPDDPGAVMTEQEVLAAERAGAPRT
jgi:hypothetical protein